MLYRITVMPQKRNIAAAAGENLLQALRREGFCVNAACGGNGSCGKCKVFADGSQVLACRVRVDRDMTVTLPEEALHILTDGIAKPLGAEPARGCSLAFDIGTTTVAGYLLDPNGQELASLSVGNPQLSFGADVISRIQSALHGNAQLLTGAIRKCVADLAQSLCQKAQIPARQICTVSIVGNPAMQQLFLGMDAANLAKIPFAPALTRAESRKAEEYLPAFCHAQLLIVPDISGFVGADTVACILATGLHEKEELTLLVDIGTNGEMVLGNKHRMVACSAAAGPALEGANIARGMRGQPGAIDHVYLENGAFRCSVIGGGEAAGICGSGLVDAVAACLDAGRINARGRIQNPQRRIDLTDQVYLTQEDIRQVQLAKGAIAAGITQMAAHLGVSLEQIQKVYLAGAFGSFMDAASACRIGLLPSLLEDRITAVGNAAGSGAKMLAANAKSFAFTQEIVSRVEFIELASTENFQRQFAQAMRFTEAQDYWCGKALALGFSKAVPLSVATLQPRQDVRAMCAADQCGAYGRNWTCPPHCGSLDQCAKKMGSYSRGILLQTVGETQKRIDTKAYRRTEERHMEQFRLLCRQLRKRYPDALCLGAGGCRICGKCAFPEACRFPREAYASMEGYGLFVTQVCRDNGLSYHYGEGTITYTACILF